MNRIYDKMEKEEKQILVEGITSFTPYYGPTFIKSINNLTNKILIYKNHSVLCKYESLALWRFWTMRIESDLLIACFCANRSLEYPDYKVRFDWKMVVDHDNEVLNNILRQDIVDNHNHLVGLLPIFSSSWTTIMTDNSFRKGIEDSLSLNNGFLERAAFIRQLLLKQLFKNGIRIIKKEDGQLFGITRYYEERELMYYIFRECLKNNTQFYSYEELFYEYVVIKEKFRGLFAQSISGSGITDFFSINNNRKRMLNACDNIGVIIRSGLTECLKNTYTDKMEIRIGLKTSQDLYNYIKLINAQISSLCHYIKVKYIICFSRRKVEKDNIPFRNQSKRNELERDFKQLSLFFEKYSSVANSIVGIDVSSREDLYNPEVFSELMHKSIKINGRHLKRMFHIGEEFSDLLTGLRRIDECLSFFDLNANDRLGHAIPAYEDVKQWYCIHNNTVNMPKEDYLDNIAWLFCNLPVNKQLSTEAKRLEEEFSLIFKELYKNAFDDNQRKIISLQNAITCEEISIKNYFDAWKLRKNNPENIKKSIFDGALLHDEKISYYIAYLYFYQEDVWTKGKQLMESSITPGFLNYIEIMQKVVQKRIRDRGVCIEVCPSSNYFLKAIPDGYIHPVISLYEKYRTDSIVKDICVSINTDDMDVFSTSLYNEYSLVANAYEMNRLYFKDTNSEITDFYEWLDKIRQNSIKMFCSDSTLP